MAPAAPVEITDPAAMLAKARQLDESSLNAYNQVALACAAGADAAFDRQLENIQRFGPGYLALQSFEKSAGCRCWHVAHCCVGMNADTAPTSARHVGF
jgi:hypothetical protein